MFILPSQTESICKIYQVSIKCLSNGNKISKISKIFIFHKLGFFCISPRIGAFGIFRDYFANLANLNFFVFLNELEQLATFEASLQISEICNNFQVVAEKFFYFDR